MPDTPHQLLPCPFCGGEAMLVPIYNGVTVKCLGCNAEGEHCYSVNYIGRSETEAEAITAWNTRKGAADA
jgi:Lar family restriction alleviation protein